MATGRDAPGRHPRRQLGPRADGPVRRAARLRSGHLPQTSWFPYLGLGSPQFLHYQSLPSTITGAVGIAVGPDRAFSWSLYLLLSLWPVSVYWGATGAALGALDRGHGGGRCPRSSSRRSGVGFETKAYVWVGFGVWTQLWAMWTLPLAWGFCWQAVSEGRRYGAAVLFTSLTVMLHFETGYLAVLPLFLLPWLTPSAWRARVVRAPVVLAGTLAATAWVTVPVLVSARWASVNEVLRGTPLENGYGARRVLGWLVTGGLLDARSPARSSPSWPASDSSACVVRFRAGRARPGAPRAAGHEPGALVRPDHVRTTGRRPPWQHRHLHAALHDGHPAHLAAPGRCRGIDGRRRCSSPVPGGEVGRRGNGTRVACWSRVGLAAVLAGVAVAALVPALAQSRALRQRERGRHPRPGDRRRARRTGHRPIARPGTSRRRRPCLRRTSGQLGRPVPGGSGSGVQVPREPGHRRSRLHPPHRLADD